ncbi:OprD family outer membrane porin [Sulfuricurvum sp.]|uniref:OprD family outer membrane porin n=1 Tax=Sulfuricurvum sp. TaxID=2025608 RepID=UPI0026085E46|nr:OprD family outer membrane porin [Sulfuricurvum sp.]MDD2265293.1 OprD family outer membrane porin [Sulfuricurvum sp.]MDD2783778.1 OprD family outer membrane porin [Sulfuricurvum sp.]
MKKTIMMGLATATALNASAIEDVVKEGTLVGQIRAAYVVQNNALDSDTYGTSLGGMLKYETVPWNGVKAGFAAYLSQKLPFVTGNNEKANGDLFAADAKSYLYLGEAYLDYTTEEFALRIGRQQINTPLADTDDIRMHPNTFEAAMASYKGFEGTILVGGYITRFAGYDSGNDISKFKKLDGVESKGAAIVGATNESIENLALQGWYYKIDHVANVFYTDAGYGIVLNESAGVELAGQFGHFSEENNSGIEGNVYGIGATLNVGMMALGATYNKTFNDTGKAVSNGFGGGQYYTSMEETTIDGFEDARAYQLTTELDMGAIGIEGLKLAALYGSFKGKRQGLDARVSEYDAVAAYAFNDAICADMSYAMIKDKNKNFSELGTDGGYDRFLLRLNYSF